MTNINRAVVEELLFDKFFLKEKEFELKDWKMFQKQSLDRIQHSIAQNIDFIINTTNSLTIGDFLNKKLTFLDFGIPDILTLYQSSSTDFNTMSKCIEHAIKAFEPRLVNPEVVMLSAENKTIITIKGRVSNKNSSFFEIAYHNLK